jgi:hypothetical protein
MPLLGKRRNAYRCINLIPNLKTQLVLEANLLWLRFRNTEKICDCWHQKRPQVASTITKLMAGTASPLVYCNHLRTILSPNLTTKTPL